ncbi:MAG: M48 family peptidase [Puniceicoccaceae bacterium]|nr:MAG: M48 family peptidase [Puniceicoccaceae bacterium]|tara:strand:- start:40 stop:750 length:711 start_codon:yes stop_codon:yes gene_type:complete
MDFLSATGQIVPVEIRRRKNTRHLRLTLGYQNQIVASVPWHTSERGLGKFIEKQRLWLDVQLSKAPRIYTLTEWLSLHPQITASGDVFEVRIEATGRLQANYTFEQGGAVLVLRLPEVDEASLVQLLRRFAKDALNCRVAYHAKRFGLSYSLLSVRDQSSRWGSCSARRGISLNWRLVLLRPELQDYIILHELAHLTEMNHGKCFWALLDQYDPNRVAHEVAIDKTSAELMRVARQ